MVLVNGVILLSCSDNSSTIIKNSKETRTVNSLIFLAIHYKQATGLTGLHIKAGTVNTCNYIIILNVVGAVRIAAICLSGIRLILNSAHFPTKGRIIVVIVCVNVNVASGDITSCDVVYHLLTVSTCCVVNLLSNTRSKLNGRRREYVVVGILVIGNIVTRKHTYVVCKCIANSTSESVKIICTGKVSCTLKRCKKIVGKIFCVNSVSNLSSCTISTKSIGHEVCCTILVGKTLIHVVHEDLRNGVNIVSKIKLTVISVLKAILNRLKYVHYVVSVKVTIIVFLAEAGIVRLVYCVTEVLFTDNSNHLVERTTKLASLHLKSSNLKKVYKVTCPTGNVGMIRTIVVVIGNIHRAEYVTDICLITVRKSKVLKILKTCYAKVISIGNLCIYSVLFRDYISRKICILVTCHNTPRSGIVSLNTGTNVLNNESYRILRRIHLYILICNLLKKSEVVNEVLIIINFYLAKWRNNLEIGSLTTKLTSKMRLVTGFGTSGSLSVELNPFMLNRKNFLCEDYSTTY